VLDALKLFDLPGHLTMIKTLSRFPRLRVVVGVLAFSAWAAALAVGFTMLARYKNGTGAQGAVPGRWPDVTRIARGEKLSLVLFAHPYCPCTRATLSQLREILSSAGDEIRTTVVFLQPDGDSQAVRTSGLWASAASIPGVQVLLDETGAEAARFGGQTSGHLVVYDADGHLRFTGGLTASRGHLGASAGKSQVLALIRSGAATPIAGAAATFGCSLQDPVARNPEDVWNN
jgi:hypothetical protein